MFLQQIFESETGRLVLMALSTASITAISFGVMLGITVPIVRQKNLPQFVTTRRRFATQTYLSLFAYLMMLAVIASLFFIDRSSFAGILTTVGLGCVSMSALLVRFYWRLP